jgi:hypothetical protein
MKMFIVWHNGRSIFITFALNQDHASFVIVPIHFNRRILTFVNVNCDK